uniref:Uncharacterized protein n=1 Tax=Kuenenia stuttgartiensis TaxID=174633 RepID=Q1PW32_KUEST|nr:unknown protein [Candidatus Kuenenia stuttgartiensis]
MLLSHHLSSGSFAHFSNSWKHVNVDFTLPCGEVHRLNFLLKQILLFPPPCGSMELAHGMIFQKIKMVHGF